MQLVEIRLKPGELSTKMAAMRGWLDQHRIDLSTFSCGHDQDGVLVTVEFRLNNQAVAFAQQFGGCAAGTAACAEEERHIQEMSLADALVG
jgi:hypothetical protein